MFCGECGAKNKKSDKFCAECGAPLVQEEEKEVVEKVTKPRQPMSKKNKTILIAVIVVVSLLGIGYKVGSDKTNPKSVAKNYIQALMNSDGSKLYGYLELDGDKTFVSKKIFSDLLKTNKKETNIENYKITEVTYGDGKLSASVKYTYTLKGSSNEKTDTVKLIKQKGKKFMLFDNWKVAELSSTATAMKDYKIKVTKDVKLTYAGVKVDSKYLNKDESTSKLDVYVLPQVFTTKTVLKAVLPTGLEIEETVTPSSYYSTHTVSFNKNTMSDATKEELVNAMKTNLTKLYENAIAKKAFTDIKADYQHKDLDLTEIEKSYTSFEKSLEDASNTLTSIEFTDMSLYDADLTDDGYLEVEVKGNYKYSVKYTDYNKEEKTKDSTGYSYFTLTLGYKDGKYYLASFDSHDLKTSFSRY